MKSKTSMFVSKKRIKTGDKLDERSLLLLENPVNVFHPDTITFCQINRRIHMDGSCYCHIRVSQKSKIQATSLANQDAIQNGPRKAVSQLWPDEQLGFSNTRTFLLISWCRLCQHCRCRSPVHFSSASTRQHVRAVFQKFDKFTMTICLAPVMLT